MRVLEVNSEQDPSHAGSINENMDSVEDNTQMSFAEIQELNAEDLGIELQDINVIRNSTQSLQEALQEVRLSSSVEEEQKQNYENIKIELQSLKH